MMDVMGYVDSDLLDEASGLFKFGSRAASRRSSSDFRSEHGSGASTTAQEFMDEDLLAALVARIAGREHQLTVDPEVIAYLALATKQRLRVMAERMIHASQHRRKSMVPLSPPTMYDVGHPMLRIEIGQHVKNQLLAIERVEREEELKRKEQVAELHRQNLAASRANVKGILRNADQTGKGGKKTVRFQFGSSLKGKAKLKEPKVVATEEQEFKFANQAALAFAGTRGKKASYAWMTAGGGVLKRPSTLAESDSTIDGALDPLSSLFMFGAGGVLGRSVDGLCGVNIPPVSVKDALFCLEHDDGSGGTGLKVLIKSYVKWKHTPLSSSRLQ
ncbi:hypothetical protein BGW39_001345 [Mortierella sp. 14UC]|nr:hypothetical protein BGW39_001345 [Mortierella sp. 14UC]